MKLKNISKRKARRIAIAEIMIPLILLGVLGFTVGVLILKVVKMTEDQNPPGQIPYHTTEMKWIVDLGIIMALNTVDLAVGLVLYIGVKKQSYRWCLSWLSLQVASMALFTTGILKRTNSIGGGLHFLNFILVAISIYIYKIHHVSFIYGLLPQLKPLPDQIQGQGQGGASSSGIDIEAHMPREPRVTLLMNEIKSGSDS